MSKRLAITISGAVSLGSYEAGVLYEICEALRQHNEDPETIANPADRIEIDVLTGASAGGMTAVIAAQSLLYSRNALKDPTNRQTIPSTILGWLTSAWMDCLPPIPSPTRHFQTSLHRKTPLNPFFPQI